MITENLPAALHNASIQAINVAPAQPPGLDQFSLIISWILWGAGIVLFVFFIFGLVSAGRARRHGNEIEAPIWPLAAAALLGASATIWNVITG